MAAFTELPGLTFNYPDNWKVEAPTLDQLQDGAVVQISVAGPETAMWQVSRHPTGTDLEPLFDEALAAIRAEYREIEVAADSGQIEGCTWQGYEVNFYYLDFTVTVFVRGFVLEEGVYLLVCQAEDRELERVGPVFDAMLASLLRGLG